MKLGMLHPNAGGGWLSPRLRPFAAGLGCWSAVLAGIVVGQVVLYGPSLAGRKLLLPLDCLAEPRTYLPASAEPAVTHNHFVSDLVLGLEPARRFMASELHAGRWPSWSPYQYAGAPDVLPKFSPFWLLVCSVMSPLVVAWEQLLLALVAGVGTYQFCRHVLKVGRWPATLTAWCSPLTAFFVFWQGYTVPLPVVWLPWILLAVDQAVRTTSWWAGPALAAVTGVTLVSGHLDAAGQVLLASGIYALWCFTDQYWKAWLKGRAVRAALTVGAGWALGFLLAAPYVLPLLEYTQTGVRMAQRSAGHEERPPVGLAALPQTVLPDIYGSNQAGSVRLMKADPETQQESSATAYTGLLATLLVAPLAWCSRRHRSMNICWAVLAVISLAWVADLPGVVDLLHMPGLKMMSFNRFVFAASFAVLAMAATGMEVLSQGTLPRRWWFWLPAAMVAGLFVWCIYRAMVPPEALATDAALIKALQDGRAFGPVQNLAQASHARWSFFLTYLAGALLSALALSGWIVLWFSRKTPRWFVPALGALLLGDLLWFGYGRSAQCDRALYYPPIPVLDALARETPGRVVGFYCLPATLSQTRNLRDIRGYDGVDPARLVDLLMIAADPRSPRLSYALIQWYVPKIETDPSGAIRLHPILDMLNVRYVIFRGSPPAKIKPDFSGDDYWVMTNRRALPRVFVPENVETVEDDRQRLSKLANPEFDPARVAYAESPVNLSGPSQGSAEIVHEIPTEITVSVDMQTPGVVVLADRWDKGWNAYLDGRPVRILRINHAIRGVQVPKGKATLEFRYEPESSVWGLRFAGLSLLVSLSWVGMSVWLRNARQTHAFEPSRPIEAASQGNRTEGTAKTNLREPGTKPPR